MFHPLATLCTIRYSDEPPPQRRPRLLAVPLLLALVLFSAVLLLPAAPGHAAAPPPVEGSQTIRYDRGFLGLFLSAHRERGDLVIDQLTANHGEGFPVDGRRIRLYANEHRVWVRGDRLADVKGGQHRVWRSLTGLAVDQQARVRVEWDLKATYRRDGSLRDPAQTLTAYLPTPRCPR